MREKRERKEHEKAVKKRARERLKGSKIVHKSSKKFQRAITITHNGAQKQCSNVVSDKEDAQQATKIGRMADK